MKEKIGVFVSESTFSQVACNELKSMGYNVVAFNFGQKIGYEEEIVLDFGDIDGFINCARESGIKKLVFAGKIEASSVFNREMSDSGKRFLDKTFDLRPENILKNLTSFLFKNGIEIIPLTLVFKNHLAQEKIYTRLQPDARQWNDICTGWKIAKLVSRLGIGQAIAIKDKMVISVEGIEGTDNMIKRSGSFCKDFIVVKVMKSGQDTRFDLPTAGPETIKNLILTGGRILVVEAGKTVLIENEKMVRIANENNLVILGFMGKEIRSDNKRKP